MVACTHGLYCHFPEAANKSEMITWHRHKHNIPMRWSLPRERQTGSLRHPFVRRHGTFIQRQDFTRVRSDFFFKKRQAL